MAKQKSLVEDAILQMKNLEEAVAENAKGILASTMKEEISELVKESLSEQEEDEIETDVEMDNMGDEEVDTEVSDMGDEEMGSQDAGMDDMMSSTDVTMDTDMDSDVEEPIDISNEENDEVLRVFELMGPNDKLIVKKDSAGNINVKDNESSKEYMIVGEGEEMDEEYDEMDESYEEEYESEEYDEMDESEEMDEQYEEEYDEMDESIESIVDKVFGTGDDESYEEEEDEKEDEEIVYEIEMEKSVYEGLDDEEEDEDEEEEEDENEEEFYESEFVGGVNESKKMSKKPKGVGMGKPKFKYKDKPNMSGGFKTSMKKGDTDMGTGKAKKLKDIYKDGANMDGKMKSVKKKVETKEAARTLGNGKSWGRNGLPKPKSSPRHIRLESTDAELQILREKNEEYRKALNVFRNKLNEVAVFNSNLAYATRLFTEHSTSKQEKINILRRFDTVETLKESKNLYKQIKDELGTSKTESINESVERVVTKTPSTGSSANLIESKTYENPQFLRMKDLMSKLK